MARVLWIDDNAGKGTAERLAFDGLIYFVEKNDHDVTIASTTKQIELALQNIPQYDLLILDIIMEPLPSLDSKQQLGGIDVLESIAAAGGHIPILILTVMSGKQILNEANRRGLDLSLVGLKKIMRKGSVTPTELAEEVERYLGTRPASPREAD